MLEPKPPGTLVFALPYSILEAKCRSQTAVRLGKTRVVDKTLLCSPCSLNRWGPATNAKRIYVKSKAVHAHVVREYRQNGGIAPVIYNQREWLNSLHVRFDLEKQRLVSTE